MTKHYCRNNIEVHHICSGGKYHFLLAIRGNEAYFIGVEVCDVLHLYKLTFDIVDKVTEEMAGAFILVANGIDARDDIARNFLKGFSWDDRPFGKFTEKDTKRISGECSPRNFAETVDEIFNPGEIEAIIGFFTWEGNRKFFEENTAEEELRYKRKKEEIRKQPIKELVKLGKFADAQALCQAMGYELKEFIK